MGKCVAPLKELLVGVNQPERKMFVFDLRFWDGSIAIGFLDARRAPIRGSERMDAFATKLRVERFYNFAAGYSRLVAVQPEKVN